MATYTVTAERVGKWWALECAEVPGALSQVSRLDQVEAAMREAISFVADVDPATITVRLSTPAYEVVKHHLDEAVALRDEAARAQQDAKKHLKEAAIELHGADLSVRDIGFVMGVSYQRAHQILKD